MIFFVYFLMHFILQFTKCEKPKKAANQLPSKTCSDSQKSVPKLTITHGKKRPFSVSPLSARFLPGIHHTLISFIFQCVNTFFQIRNRTLKLSDFRLQTLDVGRSHFAIRRAAHLLEDQSKAKNQ